MNKSKKNNKRKNLSNTKNDTILIRNDFDKPITDSDIYSADLNIYTFALFEEIFDIISKEYMVYHGENFLLNSILEKIFIEKYPEIYKVINLKIFALLLQRYIKSEKEGNTNIFIRIETENMFYLVIKFNNEKLAKNPITIRPFIKLAFFIIPSIILITLFLIPGSRDELLLNVKFNEIFFCIFFLIYIWLIYLTRNLFLYLSIIPLYGVTKFLSVALDEHELLFFPYGYNFDLNVAICSLICLLFILLSVKFLGLFSGVQRYLNHLKLLSKPNPTVSDISKYLKDEQSIKSNHLSNSEKALTKIGNFFHKVDLSVDLSKVLSSKNFSMFSIISIISYILFLYIGPTNEDYFSYNLKECNLISENFKISKLSNDNNRVLVLHDEPILDGNLVKIYNENKINFFKNVDELKFPNMFPMYLTSHKKYIYKEFCNRIP